MSTPSPGRRDHPPGLRRGSHRDGPSILGALLPSVLAVAAVASLITALAVWQGEEPGQPGAAASTTTPSASASTPSTPSTPASTPSAANPASTPSAEISPASGTSAAPAQPSESETAGATPEVAVVVLNQTSRRGLAGTVADGLREAGWRVPAVGDFRGVVPSTTVYYPDGTRSDALAVAADLPSEPRVRPRFGNLSTSRLTVVVTDSFPG